MLDDSAGTLTGTAPAESAPRVGWVSRWGAIRGIVLRDERAVRSLPEADANTSSARRDLLLNLLWHERKDAGRTVGGPAPAQADADLDDKLSSGELLLEVREGEGALDRDHVQRLWPPLQPTPQDRADAWM